MTKPKLWVTYAWADNEHEDVEFYISRLQEKAEVNFDKRSVGAGKRHWEEFADQIANKCDAWVGIVSPSSLSSQRWREEAFYALDRALYAKEKPFPMLFLVLGEKPAEMPSMARVRLYVSITENDWRDKIIAGAKGEAAPYAFKTLDPFTLRAYDMGNGVTSFEVRLREGTWSTWRVFEPAAAAKIAKVTGCAPGTPRTYGMFSVSEPEVIDDPQHGKISLRRVLAPAISPSHSAYIEVNSIPDWIGMVEGTTGTGFKLTAERLRGVRVEVCP